LLEDTSDLELCKDILLTDFVAEAENIANKTAELDIFPAIYSLYDIFYSIDPLLSACVAAPADAIPFLQSRFDDALDIKLFVTNVVHNYQFISDSWEDVKSFMFTPIPGGVDD